MKLLIFMSHLDDFELSCFGYVKKYFKNYSKIDLIVASKNEYKDSITRENIDAMRLGGVDIKYTNLGFESTNLYSSIDSLKEEFYKNHIDWNSDFDILTHDDNDLHTDHKAVHLIAMGAYKYTKRFVTVYSPSSLSFKPNLFIPLTKNEFNLKKRRIQKYDIKKDHSFSKLGYYFENHWNLGMAYVMENKIKYDSESYDVYRILKWE